MRRIILTFGLLCGAIIAGFLVTVTFLWDKGIFKFENGEFAGYASMLVAFSMIFFGIKTYRDRQQNGAIKFLTGLKIGLWISVIASFMYATAWEVYYQTSENLRNNFMDQYTEHCLSQMKNDGASEEEIAGKAKELAEMKEMYKNPAMRYGWTLVEIFPVGLAVTLISAGVLRRKEVLPA